MQWATTVGLEKNIIHREQKTEKQITEATLIANGLPG